MNSNDTNKTKPIHHANLVISENGRNFVFEILKNDLGFNTKANPDLYIWESGTFGIEDARALERWVISKPLGGEVKAALIVTNAITFEAQNALLKVLEEPPAGTYIFISMESLGGILPTFLSRVRVIHLSETKPEAKAKSHGSKFLEASLGEKLSMVRNLSKKEDKGKLLELLKSLETAAYKENSNPENLKRILLAKAFAASRGSSPKMLLEWLSCVL